MIILTYISGLLTAMIIVLAIVSVRAYKKYTILLESNQHTLNISTIRTADANTRMEEIEDILTICISWLPLFLLTYKTILINYTIFSFKCSKYFSAISHQIVTTMYPSTIRVNSIIEL